MRLALEGAFYNQHYRWVSKDRYYFQISFLNLLFYELAVISKKRGPAGQVRFYDANQCIQGLGLSYLDEKCELQGEREDNGKMSGAFYASAVFVSFHEN